jgi:hypothetical protein
MATPFPFVSGAILTAAQMNSIGEASVSYTPTVTSGSGSFTTVSATGSYQRVNKMVVVRFEVTITTNGTAASSVIVSLPFSCTGTSGSGVGSGREKAVLGNMFQVSLASTTTVSLLSPLNAYPGGTGYVLGGFAILEGA